jgi:hypothetical protein
VRCSAWALCAANCQSKNFVYYWFSERQGFIALSFFSALSLQRRRREIVVVPVPNQNFQAPSGAASHKSIFNSSLPPNLTAKRSLPTILSEGWRNPELWRGDVGGRSRAASWTARGPPPLFARTRHKRGNESVRAEDLCGSLECRAGESAVAAALCRRSPRCLAGCGSFRPTRQCRGARRPSRHHAHFSRRVPVRRKRWRAAAVQDAGALAWPTSLAPAPWRAHPLLQRKKTGQ